MSNKKNSVIIGSRSTISNNESQGSVELPSGIKETDKSSECKNRKLHKAFIKGWTEDIQKNGFARCIIASCNFISADVLSMQKHYKSCNGVSLGDKNSCKNCGSVLSTSKDDHKHICMGASKGKANSAANERLKRWKDQIKTVGQAFCGNQECDFVGMKLTDLEEHSRYCTGVQELGVSCCIHCFSEFPTKEELLKHQDSCSDAISNSKKVENLHFRVIKQMKNKDTSEEHIIQPGPDLPKGQYRRRRAYRAEHKNSWALTLERFKYVKCIYQNCYFIAMSLEDMIAHFGYCNGDGSFAKFVCPYCNGRVTSEAVLLKHIERSHSLENNSVKMEQQQNEFQNSESPNVEEPTVEPSRGEKALEPSTTEHSCLKEWQDQIKEYGHGYCRKSLCNFMAPTIPKLEAHWKTCDGTPNFVCLNCQRCRYRMPTKGDLARHTPFCEEDRPKYFANLGDGVLNSSENSQSEDVTEDDFEIGPVFRQYQSKPPKIYSNQRKPGTGSQKPTNGTTPGEESENQPKETPKQKLRGRPKKSTENAQNVQREQVKCGKCDFRGAKSDFVTHNLRTHVGLGWIEGESPVDMNDEKLVIKLVKEAFRLNKKGACEKCNDVKRSVMGFVTHIQNCGKTEEEKNALKAQCPYCDGKYLKYSLSSHIKLSHSNPVEEGEKSEPLEAADLSGKRRSAIKAVTKLHQVLTENDEAEGSQENCYILYEKGSEKVPKLNSKLNNLWYKLKREKKKIPCRHPNCKNLSEDVKSAKSHHYDCPALPDKVFMCELCDFYSQDEPTVQSHVTTHRKYLKQKKTTGEYEVKDEEMKEQEEEDEEDEENEDDDVEEEQRSSEEELDEPRKRKKRRDGDDRPSKKSKLGVDAAKPNLDVGYHLKQSFCKRDNLQSHRGFQLYCNGLVMTMEEEMGASGRSWPELHTTPQDWSPLPVQDAERYLPELTESVSVRFSTNEGGWRKFERFGSDLIEGVPVMFTGGSVRSMSWCKTSFKRMVEKTRKQYLAVTTAKKLDHLKDIYERSSSEKSGLFQIWDCGPLENDIATHTPKFLLGIVQSGGEIWDLAWFPEDTYEEGAEGRMTRLGLLATAGEDGAVRVWSVCDPTTLDSTKGLPIYRTDPVVVLTGDTDVEESCLKLSIASDGVIAGGFANGNVAVWNLKNVSSPFCKKSGRTRTIRAHLVFHPHKASITALSFCPLNSRYISTAGLDRFVKVWDLEFPSVPVEQYNKEYSLDNIWTLNWPSVIYNFDDVVVSLNKGAVKFIRDILTDRHQSTFSMSDACLSLSFSDWLNSLCGGSISGEVKFKLLKNLIQDQKKSQSTISTVVLEKLNGAKEGEKTESGKEVERGRQFATTYEEVVAEFGLLFRDNLGVDKGKTKKSEVHPEEFPIRAVNKIAFNPNFKSFTHIAIGYNCGLIRIQPLRELQSVRGLKFLLEKAQKEKV